MTVRHVHTNAVPDGTATSVVRPSDWNSAHAQALTLLGNTLGASTISGTNIHLAGGNGITLSGNGQTLSFHGATDYLSSGQSTAFAAAAHVHSHASLTGLDNDQHPRLTNFMSTTLLVGGGVTINAGDPTLFDIAAGVGIIVDNYTDPENPTRTVVSWSAKIGNATPFLATNPSSAVGIDINGDVVVTIDEFDEEQRRDIIACGSVTHVNGVEIEFTDNYPVFNVDPANQLMDFLLNFGAFNIDGNEYGASSTDLTLQRAAGKTFIAGGNYATSRKSPNVCVTSAENPIAEVYYYYRDVVGAWVNTDAPLTQVDPDNYDTGAGKAAVPAGKFTIQTIFFYGPYASTDVQYGQVLYDSMAEAEAAVQDAIEINPWVGTWDTFRAWMIVQQGCTDLSNTATAKFISAGKLGLVSVASGGGTGGEVNTASNEGTAGVGVFIQKIGVNLEFKNIATASPRVSVSNDVAGSNIRLDVVESVIDHNALSNLAAGNPHPQYAASNHSHGNPTLALTNLTGTTASNSAGLTLSLSGNAAQTNQTVGLYAAGNTTGQSSSSTRDARSVTFDGAGIVSVGWSNSSYRISATQSNQAFSAAGGVSAFQTLSFNNANGFTFSNVGGAIQGSYTVPSVPAQTNQTLGLYASSNTTGQSSSTTVDARSLSVRGMGIASVGYSAGEFIVSVPAGGGGGDGVNIVAAGTRTATTAGTVLFGDANGITFGLNAVNGSQITASHNGLTTAAASDHSHGNPQLNLTNLSGTTASNSAGFTLSLSAAAPGGGGGGTISMYEPSAQFGFLTTGVSIGNGSIPVIPIIMQGDAIFSRADHLVSLSLSSSSNSSHAGVVSIHFGIYTRNGNTLSLATSGSQSHQWTNTSNNSMSSVSGLRILSAPLAATLTPGNYWVAMLTRTSTTNANWFSASNIRISALTNQITGLIGEVSNSTKQRLPGLGMFSATSSVMPASMAFSNINGQGAGVSNNILVPYIRMVNFSA